ncbi:MAG TPA: hypothetical protein VK653_17495 [Xanthobacteraceae bacterium]|jgi:hypothetical protein|nr:hypothetical protein [Xanthobacteraceae bacterium]
MRSDRVVFLRKFFIVAAFLVLSVSCRAAAEEGPGECLGIGFEVQHPITIAKVIADRPQVHFIKSAADDSGCPADREACLAPSYLIPGDLVLVGKTHRAYSCVSYQSAADRTPRWTVGWLPSATMTPIMPASAPAPADWIGRWIHAGGEIAISKGRRGNLRIRGEAVYPAAQNVHSGVIHAEAKPAHGVLQFAEDGSVPFNRASAEAGNCLVRMQRIAALLVIEDNTHCGGVLVTFTGFYRRKK